MHYGICLLSIVPCRKEPSGTSEMVTQLLFGEQYTVIEQAEDWIKIVTAYDQYECWISRKQHYKLSEQSFKALKKQSVLYSGELVQVINDKKTGTSFPVTLGASLPFLKNNRLQFDERDFEFEGLFTGWNEKRPAKDLVTTAFLLMHAPYLWGGKTPFGIDCSGFTQLVYKLNGYYLPRDAYQQVDQGIALTFVEEADAGDLAYFDNENGKIVHVGILLNNHQIIHASGSVRIDRFDHYGIYNGDTKKYSHTLRVIKRVL
ncbi:MAG: C40 family peptidase [Bacteroidota bacterium]